MRRAGAEGREDLVDHRGLRDERDAAHDAVAGGTREGVDLEDLLEQRRRRAFAHRRLASVGASRGAGTMAGGPAAAASAAFSRMPRGRLAYQPEYRVVTCPLSGKWTSTRARNSSGSTVSVPAVGPADLSDRYVTAFAPRSYVSRSSATGFRAQYRASRVANARSSSGTQTAPCTWNPE